MNFSGQGVNLIEVSSKRWDNTFHGKYLKQLMQEHNCIRVYKMNGYASVKFF